MKYLFLVILIILVVMSIAAGGAKVFGMPQEVQFFTEAGLNQSWLLLLGSAQIVGGLLAIYYRTRRAGSAIMALGFLASTIVILMTGNANFALISLLPVLLATLLFWRNCNVR